MYQILETLGAHLTVREVGAGNCPGPHPTIMISHMYSTLILTLRRMLLYPKLTTALLAERKVAHPGSTGPPSCKLRLLQQKIGPWTLHGSSGGSALNAGDMFDHAPPLTYCDTQQPSEPTCITSSSRGGS